MPYSFQDYITTRIGDYTYAGYRVKIQGNVVTLAREKDYGYYLDPRGNKTKEEDGHYVDAQGVRHERDDPAYDNSWKWAHNEWVKRERNVPLLKVNRKSGKVLYQLKNWSKVDESTKYYYISRFLSATGAGAGWWRGKVLPKDEIKVRREEALARHVVSQDRQKKYLEKCLHPSVLLKYGLRLFYSDFPRPQINRATHPNLLAVPDITKVQGKDYNESDRHEVRTVVTQVEEFPDPDWHFRAKLVVIGQQWHDSDDVDSVWLFGRDPTNQLWLHQVPRRYALSSIETADRWLMWMQKGDVLVATS